MSIIKVENLGKKYTIGHDINAGGVYRYQSLRESMAHTARGFFQRLRHPLSANTENIDLEEFWALKDLDVEVQVGDRVGIIGSNGAGKSTFLKILSRITEPTAGRVEILGRVSSLLEVGTGFHPELSGRENIYLNGAILGMKKWEISRRFDEIVAFAEIERFLDTPIKRYSSGMYVRLAFAVAAHLDSETLIVDEVLAVGDTAFQAKCLRKMDSVSREEGRTILFVSHNMGVVSTLCSRALLLEAGRVIGDGDVGEQISRYLGGAPEVESEFELSNLNDRSGDGRARIVGGQIIVGGREASDTLLSGQDLQINLTYKASSVGGRPCWAISLFDDRGIKLCHLDSGDRDQKLSCLSERGTIAVRMERLPFPPGVYTADVRLTVDGVVADYIQRAFSFRVEPGDFFGDGRVVPHHGEVVLIDHLWEDAKEPL